MACALILHEQGTKYRAGCVFTVAPNWGSVSRGDDGPESDVDLLVDFARGDSTVSRTDSEVAQDALD